MTTTTIVEVGTDWGADVAAGSTSVTLQLRQAGTVLFHVGPSQPANTDYTGGFVTLDGVGMTLAAGDNLYLRSPNGPTSITVFKGA